MKYIQSSLLVLFLLILALPYFGLSQSSAVFELDYEVNRVYPPLAIKKEKLKAAQTLSDLNQYYKPAWVSAYISVEILTINKGIVKKVTGKSDTLNQAQKDNMYKADAGSDIRVNIRYLPENTLVHNDIKTFNFTFTVEPESEAAYPGGRRALEQYLAEAIGNQLTITDFKEYNLTAVKFTIIETGQISNVHIFEPAKDEKVDTLLLATICNMPDWKPAEYANGHRVKQEFVLTAGDHRSCVINLLNIRRTD